MSPRLTRRWPGVPEQPARHSKTRVMRVPKGPCECQGPRGRISRASCPPPAACVPMMLRGDSAAAKGSHRRGEGGGEGSRPSRAWRCPIRSGVGPGPARDPSPTPSAGFGLDATRPRISLVRRLAPRSARPPGPRSLLCLGDQREPSPPLPRRHVEGRPPQGGFAARGTASRLIPSP